MPSDITQRARRGRKRMTSSERRQQLITVARGLFAQKGLEGTSVEQIAARAQVSKPVVYEHFGGKEGLYAVIVDREMHSLEDAIHKALAAPVDGYRAVIESAAMAMLDYIDRCPDGFRIISRDSASGSSGSTFASILSDITARVEDLLIVSLEKRGYDPYLGHVFAQGLVGMIAHAGLYWLDERQPPKDELGAQLANLAWNGLAHLEHDPQLCSSVVEARRPDMTQCLHENPA